MNEGLKMKNILKRFLAASCVMTLVMTTPGVVVLADEMAEEEVVLSDISVGESNPATTLGGSIQEYNDENVVVKEDEGIADLEDAESLQEPIGDESEQTEEVFPDDVSVEEEFPDTVEETVGANTWTVGNNVTATLIREGDEDILYFDSNEGTLSSNWRSKLGSSAEIIDQIKFTDSSTKMYLPANSVRLFCGDSNYGLVELNEIDLSKIDTSNVVYMDFLFSGCNGLTSLNLSGLDTANVISMGYMFEGCSNLTSLNLSGLDTANVTDMNSMFQGCSSLIDPDLKNLCTSNVSDMNSMFQGCSSLTSLDLRYLDTLNAVYMDSMFSGCNGLTSLDLSSFDTSNVFYMSHMFEGCSSLTSLDLSRLETPNVTDMSYMFNGCSNLANLDLSRLDTPNIYNMSHMFDGCSSLTNLDLGNLDTPYVRNMGYMFNGCSNLTSLNLSCVDTSKVTDMENMFNGCSSLTNLDLSSFDTTKVTKVNGMLSGCTALELLKTPFKNSASISLPITMYDEEGTSYSTLPVLDESITLVSRLNPSQTSISQASISAVDNSYVYTGSAIKPNPVIKLNGKTLVYGTDYNLTYVNNLNVDTATITATGKGVYKDSVSCEFAITPRNISDGTASTASTTYSYTGQAINPDITLVVNSITLVKDRDYTLTYENATEIGTATITAHGTGNYTGEKSCTFEIVQPELESIAKTEIHTPSENYVYTGAEIKPIPVIDHGGYELVYGRDYDLTYENNLNVGTATVTAHGKGDYIGTISCTYAITPRSISGGTASTESATYPYTGEAINPDVTLVVNSRTLVKDVDYTLAYKNNTEAGTATVTAHGIGNYTGEKSCTFEIVQEGPVSIEAAEIHTKSESYVYTGTPRNPSPIITLNGKTLVKDTDYDLTYENDVNVGTATVIAHGKGDYTGTISCNYGITPRDISDGTASTRLAEYAYTTTPRHPNVTLVVNSITLIKDVDFTLTYENDTEVGTATVTAHGIGNYTGEKSCTFKIVKDGPLSIAYATITTKSPSYVYTGTPRNPSPIITLGGRTLVKGTDYDLTYENSLNVGTGTVTAHGKGDYKGTISCTYGITPRDIGEGTAATENKAYLYTGQPIKPEIALNVNSRTLVKGKDYKLTYANNTEAGTAIVTARGIGNYTGEKSCTFDILEKAIDISKCSVASGSLSYGYSGKAYTPAVIVKHNGVTLTQDTDYTVKYQNNKNPGIATITVTGIGIYTGTRIKTFEIVNCVSTLVSGRTYQLIPKNNSSTAVCSFGGRMTKNTKVYITDRSASEAMKFKAIKNSDGSWKFINEKCELALAVRQNSTAVGAGIVLYDQTNRQAQNWKLSRKSDNSFAIINSVTGYSIAMSDASAVRGTTLSMAETASSGLQRFYLAETESVNASFDGTYSIRAWKDKTFAINVASSSKADGANVNLLKYTNSIEKKFKAVYSGSGYYRFVNGYSGMVLTVDGNTKTNGANVIQSEWKGDSGQRWKIIKHSDGSVTLQNALGTVLHLNGNKTQNGTNVVARSAATTKAQWWYLERA